MDEWMDGCMRMDGCMHACMHACMHGWSRVPCCRERELGGPYHWGGARSVSLGDHTMGGGQGSEIRTHIYIYIYIYITHLSKSRPIRILI